jgi:hypothetical protein
MDPEDRFPIWFYYGRLRGMGWPRKRGLFRKTHYVDAHLADSLLQELLAVGSTVGAGDRDVGLRLIANVFDGRDWTAVFGPEEFDFLEQSRLRVEQLTFADEGSDVTWRTTLGRQAIPQISSGFAGVVMHGILNAGGVAPGISASSSDRGGAEREAHQAALRQTSTPESSEAELEDALSLVAEFEDARGSLPPPPTVLTAAVVELVSAGDKPSVDEA